MLIIRTVSQAFQKLVADFGTLQRIQFAAPWRDAR